MAVGPRRISDIKPLLTNLAQTSHYEVQFGVLPSRVMSYLRTKGIDYGFISESAGLLCYSASLPTSNLASNTISGNYMGIQEKFAHTRMYDEISLDFYVDRDYKMIKFLECWMEYIASGSSVSPNVDNYFIRMQYPAYYKANAVKIVKFDRDYQREIEYNFRGLYPRNISSIPVSYMNSDTLRVSATFSYDRYIAGKSNRINEVLGDSNNRDSLYPEDIVQNPLSADEFVKQNSQSSFVFGVDSSQSSRSVADSLSKNALSSQANPSYSDVGYSNYPSK